MGSSRPGPAPACPWSRPGPSPVPTGSFHPGEVLTVAGALSWEETGPLPSPDLLVAGEVGEPCVHLIWVVWVGSAYPHWPVSCGRSFLELEQGQPGSGVLWACSGSWPPGLLSVDRQEESCAHSGLLRPCKQGAGRGLSFESGYHWLNLCHPMLD